MAKRQRSEIDPTAFEALGSRLEDLSRDSYREPPQTGQAVKPWVQNFFESHDPKHYLDLSVASFNNKFNPTGLECFSPDRRIRLGVKVADNYEFFSQYPIDATVFDQEEWGILRPDSAFRQAAARFMDLHFAYVAKSGEFIQRSVGIDRFTDKNKIEYIPRQRGDIIASTAPLRFYYWGKKGGQQSLSFFDCWYYDAKRMYYVDIEYWPFHGGFDR